MYAAVVSSKQFALLLQALPHLKPVQAGPPRPSPRELTLEPPLVPVLTADTVAAAR